MSENEDLSSDERSENNNAYQVPGSNLSLLDQQTHDQRKSLFRWCLGIIVIFYLIAFSTMIWAFYKGSFLSWAIIEHPHIMAIPLSLFIIPSFLLWGIVRGVYKMNQDNSDLLEFLKTIKNHPFLN